MEECIFCKIVKGGVPSAKVYENEHILAFLDIMPVNKGHTLVIPKTHFKDLEETPDEILVELIKVVKKLAPAVMAGSGAPAFNIGINNGQEAGQVVPHFHLHVIPRLPNDGHKLWEGGQYKDEEEMKRVAETIKAALK